MSLQRDKLQPPRQNNLVKQCRMERVFGEKCLLVLHSAVFIISCIINVVLNLKRQPTPCIFISTTSTTTEWSDVLQLSPKHPGESLSTGKYQRYRLVFFFLCELRRIPRQRTGDKSSSHSTSQVNGSPCKMMLSNAKPNLKTGCLQ